LIHFYKRNEEFIHIDIFGSNSFIAEASEDRSRWEATAKQTNPQGVHGKKNSHESWRSQLFFVLEGALAQI